MVCVFDGRSHGSLDDAYALADGNRFVVQDEGNAISLRLLSDLL